MHHKADRRETFRAKLSESLEVESEEWMFLLAGLRETGLSYKDTERGPKVWMKQPGLSNPDPDVFASRAQGALFHSDEKALETMTERGREILDKPEQKTEMQGWLANMEIAIHSS